MGAPVINNYKLPLAILRIFGSFTGGVLQFLVLANTRDSDIPGLLVGSLMALVLFALPAILAVTVSTLTSSYLNTSEVGFLSGGLQTALLIVLRLPFLRIRRAVRRVYPTRFSKYADSSDLEEEDDEDEENDDEVGIKHIKLKSGPKKGWRTMLLWILPNFNPHESILLVLIKACTSGLIVGLTTGQLQKLKSASKRFGASSSLLFFAYASVCVSVWSLTSGPPIDPNTYFSEDEYGIDGFTRPFYCTILLLALSLSSSTTTKTVILYILCIIQLLCMSCILPSLRIFVAWLLETVQIVLMGGTPMSGFVRCVYGFAFSVLIDPVLTHIALASDITNIKAWLCVASVTGCFNSSRIFFNILRNPAWKSDLILLLIRCLASVGISIWLTQGISLSQTSTTSENLASISSWSGTALLSMLSIFLGLQLIMSPTIAPFIPNPVSLFLASKRDLKKNLMRIRRSKAFLLMVIHHSIPFMSLIHCSAKTSVLALAKSPIQDGLSLLSWSSVSQSNVDLFLYVLLLSRVFRGIWMRPVHFAWDIVVWNLILSNSVVNGFEGPGGFVLGVLLVGFGRGVVGRFLNGSVVILVGLFTFWTDQKLRTDDWVLHSVLSILISPCGLMISSLLNAPLMPLLGLPIYWVGFLRPERGLTWSLQPHAVSSLYRNMLPSLLQELGKSSYIQPFQLIPRDTQNHFLVRYDSKILFVRIVESWYEGFEVVVSGLEMRGTSCHETERVIVEEVSEEYEEGRWVHGSLLEPLGTLAVKTYSDSSSILTGVLDHPDTLALIQPLFLKCLIYVIWRNLNDVIGVSKGDLRSMRLSQVPLSQQQLASVAIKYPHQWHQYLRTIDNPRDSRDAQELSILAAQIGYTVLLGLGANGSSPPLSISLINKLYSGEVSDSTPVDIRSWYQENSQSNLRQTTVKAWRLAVKITWQNQIDGGSDEDSMDDLLNTLDDHYENWHLTVHNSTLPKSKNSFRYFIEEMTWFEAVERKIPNIFIFGVAKKDEDLTTKEGAETINHRGIMRREEARVTSRVLSMTDRCKCYVGRLNDSLVKGIWANMAYELFYLTNDDDERYSIQAHKVFLRNLIIQSADPPLGYPSYMSRESISIRC